MRILYNFASRSRPEKLIKCIENIIQFSQHDNYIILLNLDIDDTTVANKEFKEKLNQYDSKVIPVYGFSKNKIDAINKNIWMVNDFDILINMADDMEWKVEGFDLIIIQLFKKYFPDTNGFLHLPDGIVNERLPTMCIMGRKLYDYFGYLYNPIYQSVYCDNEQFDVVRKLNKYVYVPIHLFTHNHYRWKLRDMDELDKRNDSINMYAIDGATYRERQAINFGLK